MQQVSALILFGIDSALHHVILPSFTGLVRLQHLRFVDIVDGGHNMAVQTFEQESQGITSAECSSVWQLLPQQFQ